MDAPAASHRTPVSMISDGVMGTWGLFFFLGSDPVVATVMINFSMAILSHFFLIVGFCFFNPNIIIGNPWQGNTQAPYKHRSLGISSENHELLEGYYFSLTHHRKLPIQKIPAS
jgi:hypothetical protein